MPFLSCIHHVQWLTRAADGKFQCSYCRAFLQRKDLYPKWDDLGVDFQAWWVEHEKLAPPPLIAPAAGGPSAKPGSPTDSAPHAPRATPAVDAPNEEKPK